MNPWTDDVLAAQLAERLDAPDQFEIEADGDVEALLELFADMEAELPEMSPSYVAQLGATLVGSTPAAFSKKRTSAWERFVAGWGRFVGWLGMLSQNRAVSAMRPIATYAALVLIIAWIALSQLNTSGLQVVQVEQQRTQQITVFSGRLSQNERPLMVDAFEYREFGQLDGLAAYSTYRFDQSNGGADYWRGTTDALYFAPPANSEGSNDNATLAGLSLSQEGEFVLGVEDVRSTQREVESIAEKQGGLISELIANLSATGLPQADMHLLVPIENFSAAMDELRALGEEVLVETMQTRDLTEQVFDIEARLANQQLVETEIAELLAAAEERGDDADAILEIYDDLVSQRELIDSTRAEQLALAEQIQFASIQVQLIGVEVIEKPDAAEAQPFWASLVFADAWVSLVTMLQQWAVLLIWMVVYAPLVLVPAGILALLRRRWRNSKQQA